MKKILHVIHGLNIGGAETFIYNLLGEIDNSRYRFDFVIQDPEIKHLKFRELIHTAGGEIHIIPDFIRNPVAHYKAMKRLLAAGVYDYVHIHMNAFINPLPAIAASKFNNTVIIHSHSTSNGKGGMIGKWLHHINRMLFLKPNFKRLSCSDLAGKWMFGSKDNIMVCNALNPMIYAYDENKSLNFRTKYRLGNAFVIGQVGRLIPLKNQEFTIRLLNEFRKLHPDIDARLLIAGDGPMRQELKEFSSDLGIEENVVFTGNVHNIADLYSAFDVLVMPSFFEGLSLVGVEAQAAGLKTIISDTIPPEINVTGTVKFCSLKDIKPWIAALEESVASYDRSIISQKIKGSSFDIKQMTAVMEEVYG